MVCIDEYITIPYAVIERVVGKETDCFHTVAKYGIYYACKYLRPGLEPYGAISMVMFYYYRKELPAKLYNTLSSALQNKIIEHCEKAKKVLWYTEIENKDVQKQVDALNSQIDIMNEIYEFCFIEIGKNTVASSIPYSTEEVILAYHKFDDINGESHNPVVLRTDELLKKIEESKKGNSDNEIDFIKSLFKKT